MTANAQSRQGRKRDETSLIPPLSASRCQPYAACALP